MKIDTLIGKKVTIEWFNVTSTTTCTVLGVDRDTGWLRLKREGDDVIAWGPLNSIRGIVEEGRDGG